jgi:CysZ protein
MLDFFSGLAYPWRGYRILRRHPELSRIWRWPMLLMGLALTTGLWLAFRYHDDLTGSLLGFVAGLLPQWLEGSLGLDAKAHGAVAWTWSALHWVADLIVLLFTIVLSFMVCGAASSVIAAPFNDALSEAVEKRETGAPAPPFSLARITHDLVRTVRLETLKLFLYVAIMVPMWVVSLLVPGVGPVIYTAFGVFFTAAYFAIDYVDWPASRHGLGIGERIDLFRRRPLLMLGFGLSLWGLLFVPFVNLALMPLAVAGGTRLFLDIEGSRPKSHE